MSIFETMAKPLKTLFHQEISYTLEEAKKRFSHVFYEEMSDVTIANQFAAYEGRFWDVLGVEEQMSKH